MEGKESIEGRPLGHFSMRRGQNFIKVDIYPAPEDLESPKRYRAYCAGREIDLRLLERVRVETNLFGQPFADTLERYNLYRRIQRGQAARAAKKKAV